MLDRYPFVVPVLFLSLFVSRAFGAIDSYGSRWELGRFGMPRAMVSSDGQTFADGTPVDPMSGILIRSGLEEEVELAFMIVLLIVLCLLALEVRRGNALRKRLAEINAKNVRYEASRWQHHSQ